MGDAMNVPIDQQAIAVELAARNIQGFIDNMASRVSEETLITRRNHIEELNAAARTLHLVAKHRDEFAAIVRKGAA